MRKRQLSNKTIVYCLSAIGSAILWSDWQKQNRSAGACNAGLSRAAEVLGPSAHWGKNNVTLGQLAAVYPPLGRGFARYAVEYIDRPELALIERPA